jgi:hypothetical protein
MTCKICGNESRQIFSKKILHKYEVNYYQCGNCFFIQTDTPFWLDEAYNSAINFTDVGLISRNNIYVEQITAFLRFSKFDRNKKYLDYGAGYGLFVRMMRDNGVNFYWADEYCENLFAKKFAATDLPLQEQQFELITSFEVFEHLPDPMQEITKILALTDSILFSTELTKEAIEEIENWWYIAPEHGQHIAFYSKKTLEYICKQFDLNLYSRKNLHLLTRRKVNKVLFYTSNIFKIAKIYNAIFPPPSLLQLDYNFYMKSK